MKNPATNAERLALVQSELATAEAHVLEVAAAENSALGDARTFRDWQGAHGAAALEVARLKRLVAMIQANVAADADSEAAKIQKQREEDADRAADAAGEVVKRNLAEITRLGREMLSALAKADLKIRGAQAGRSDELPSLLSVEGRVRAGQNRAREIISSLSVTRWAYENGLPVPDELVAKIVSSDGTTGYVRSDVEVSGYQTPVTKRRFRKIQFRSEVRTGPVTPLAEALSIPGLRSGDAPGWSPLEHRSPAVILARLDALAEVSDATPPTETELVLEEHVGEAARA